MMMLCEPAIAAGSVRHVLEAAVGEEDGRRTSTEAMFRMSYFTVEYYCRCSLS